MYKKLLGDLLRIGILVVGFSVLFKNWTIGIALGCGLGVALTDKKSCCK